MTKAMMTKAEQHDRAAAMLSPEQVAELVGLTAAGVRRGALRERLPWVKVGHRTLRCPREAVEQLVRGL